MKKKHKDCEPGGVEWWICVGIHMFLTKSQTRLGESFGFADELIATYHAWAEHQIEEKDTN